MMLGEILNAFIVGIDSAYVVDFGNGNDLAIKTYLRPCSFGIAAPAGFAASPTPNFQIHCGKFDCRSRIEVSDPEDVLAVKF